jgi:hypothetical protein
MSFGTTLTKIGLKSATLILDSSAGGITSDDPGDNIEEIRRDQFSTSGSPELQEHRVVWAALSGWTDANGSKRVKSARIRILITAAVQGASVNNLICHPSDQDSDDLGFDDGQGGSHEGSISWDDYTFRIPWSSGGGGAITTISNATIAPGGSGIWSMNAREATKALMSSDTPTWVGKYANEDPGADSTHDDTIKFYDENLSVPLGGSAYTIGLPFLVLNLGSSVVPRRMQAHRRRLT